MPQEQYLEIAGDCKLETRISRKKFSEIPAHHPCRSSLSTLGKGASKLDELRFDFEAKVEVTGGSDQVLVLKAGECKDKCEALLTPTPK